VSSLFGSTTLLNPKQPTSISSPPQEKCSAVLVFYPPLTPLTFFMRSHPLNPPFFPLLRRNLSVISLSLSLRPFLPPFSSYFLSPSPSSVPLLLLSSFFPHCLSFPHPSPSPLPFTGQSEKGEALLMLCGPEPPAPILHVANESYGRPLHRFTDRLSPKAPCSPQGRYRWRVHPFPPLYTSADPSVTPDLCRQDD